MPVVKKTKKKTTPTTRGKLSQGKKTGTFAGAGRLSCDRGLGKILAGRSADKIVPEVAARLEGARRRHLENAVKAAEAELAVLDAEAARLEKEGDPEGRKAARVARFRVAVAADAQGARTTVGAIDQRIQPEPGGWSVIGRVVDCDGVPPKKAKVVFVGKKNVPVKALTAIPVGADGMVRKAYPAATVAKLQTARTGVAAAVQVGTRIVAVDATKALVRAGRLHQFDIRIA